MNTRSLPALALRLVLAATLAASGYIHAQLYIDGSLVADVEGNKVRLSANGDVAVTMEQEA